MVIIRRIENNKKKLQIKGKDNNVVKTQVGAA